MPWYWTIGATIGFVVGLCILVWLQEEYQWEPLGVVVGLVAAASGGFIVSLMVATVLKACAWTFE